MKAKSLDPDGNAVFVFVGPSGVGKTTLLRALAEDCWSFYLEMPGPDHRVKLGSRSCCTLFEHNVLCLTEAKHCVSCYLLAKHLVLLFLFADGVVKTAADWLRAQLNGYDTLIDGAYCY